MTQRWLSEYSGRVLTFHCPRCGINKRYDADQTLAKMGDHNLRGMRVVLAEAEGCPRVFTTSTWDACRMSWQAEPTPPNEVMAAAILDRKLAEVGAGPAYDMRFSDLDEWQTLFVACRCGRLQQVDRRQFGSGRRNDRMRDVAASLVCPGCLKGGRTFFAVANLPR